MTSSLLQAATTELVPVNTPATAGPWTITITQAITGDEAIAMMQEANSENPPAPEGMTYLLARITTRNTSDKPRVINMADFAATGTDGILRRPPAVIVPETALQAIVNAGESLDGIVPFLVNDASTATIWFSSTLLGGNWTHTLFAINDQSAIPTFDMPDPSPSDTGNSPETAVQLNEPVRTGGWEITVTRLANGQEIWDNADYRTKALGEDFAQFWAGLYVKVTNLNPVPAVFPNDAFLPTDGTGEPWDNVLALTPPEPDVSRELLPGASREGWSAYSYQNYDEGSIPQTSFIRIQPNSTSDEPRYLFVAEGGGSNASTNSGGSASGSSSPAEGSSAEMDPLAVSTGDIVTTTEDLVNLRSEASASGSIIMEVPLGTQLEITGDPVEANGYRWYPVTVVETGESGFIVQDFIEP